MPEIGQIMLICIVNTSQVFWLVLMDTQKQISMGNIIVLGVAKINVSNLQLLSFMESRRITDVKKQQLLRFKESKQMTNVKKQQLLSFKDSRKMRNAKLTENKAK
jgi:hypothetical protein